MDVSSLVENLNALRRGLANHEERIDESRRVMQDLTDLVERNRKSVDESWEKFEAQVKELKERLDAVENELALMRSSGSRPETLPKRDVLGSQVPSAGSSNREIVSGSRESEKGPAEGALSQSPLSAGTEVPPTGVSGETAGVGSPSEAPELPSTPPRPAIQGPETEFNEALRVFREERSFPKARMMFRRFISSHPTHELADDAQFFIGESYFEERNFERAILAFNKVQVDYANGDKAPDALLKEALAFLSLGDKASAAELLGRVVQKYPGTDAAKTAAERLSSL